MRRIAIVLLLFAARVFAADPGTPPVEIRRATGPIRIDGDLSDPAWKESSRYDTFYETNPGDNVAPKVKTTAWLAYDDHYLYAAFDLQDPDPSQIRAPFNDHDHISGNSDDYAGIIVDPRHDGKTAILFLATARAVQYDAVSDDSTGNEDSSPDFFWDAAAKINDHGWTLEIRVPFASLRYPNRDVQTWGIMLYRNYPRAFRYQMFNVKLPRGSNCFICHSADLVGLTGLPPGGHLITAPYVTAKSIGETSDVGAPLAQHPIRGDAGADVKWTPSPDHAIDATINPDFSQIESDAAVISANQRFAIFFPEKRPFFLEDVNLFSTPIQAVYTRTITAPRWGLRATGRYGVNAYTFLVTDDRGGGSIILPSSTSSDLATQDFSTLATIGRVRHDFGNSFVSLLLADRENSDGSFNRVIGPDFQYRPSGRTSITGQYLVSDTETPNRPDLTAAWTGQKLRSHAGYLSWTYNDPKFDWTWYGKDIGTKFRADSGFVPQVGYRSDYGEAGYTTHPTGFFSRVRKFAMAQYDSQPNGAMLYRLLSFGFGADGRHSSFWRFRYAYESVRSHDVVLQRHQLLYNMQASINEIVAFVGLSGWVGQDVDFTNDRLGRGANTSLNTDFRPTVHLDIQYNHSISWLTDRTDPGEARLRLFTAQVERLRATYTFNSRSFVRAIVQNVRTNQSTLTDKHSGDLASQILFGYKLNWQTVFFVGASDLRAVTADEGDFVPSNREFFAKVSYAFQH